MVLPDDAVAFADSVVLELVHVMLPAALQLTVGVDISVTTVAVADEVQPLTDCVTVTVYEPEADALNDEVVAPEDHE